MMRRHPAIPPVHLRNRLVCKTSTPGSNQGGASNPNRHYSWHLPDVR
jgi:hypothetical protein